MTAAFFSIYGLAHIYSASFIAVIIMGIVLEAGKLVTVSALHRMWDILSIPLKAYMFTAIFGLMVLTSAGIFGYLSNAYQEDSLSLRDNATKIEMLQLDIAEYDKRLLSLDDAIKVATAEFLSSKETKISMLNAEREKLEARIAQMDADVSRVKANYITKRLELIQSYNPRS
jgi:septal ring factor EnvC (AmiA/AmiB activator)